MKALLRGALLLALLAWPAAVAGQMVNPDSAVGGEQESDQEPLPYRGTSVVYENAFTAVSLDPAYEPDYNPSYVMMWQFNPRYYLYDTLSARLSFSVEQELTDSDWTQSEREPIVSDITLGFLYSPFYKIPVVDILLAGGVTFGFPTSKVSQARTLYLSLAPTFSMRRAFDVLEGLELAYAFKYTKNFNKYTGAVSEDVQFPCPLSLVDRTECFNMGSRNPSMSFSNSFSVQMYFLQRLYATVQVGVINTLLYPVAPAEIDTLGGPVPVGESSDNTDHRASMSYAIEVGYDALDYLSFAVGVATANAQLMDDGSFRAPFFNRFSNIYLDVVLSVDGLVQTIQGMGSEEDAEVATSTTASADAAAVAW